MCRLNMSTWSCSSPFFSTGRIVLQAYSPLGSTGSPLMKEQIVQDIAKKHDIEAGNVLLSYLNNRGIVGESPHRRCLTLTI